MRGHWLHPLLIVVLAGTLYAQVSQSYFYGYDDFIEVHRAAFEDTQTPLRIITTSHFDSPKYRPAGRWLDYVFYNWGDGNPTWFRVRNIAAHIGSALALYALGSYLFPATVAFAGAALFAIHPLANQAVVGSSWTITPAAFLLLASLVLLLRLQNGWPWLLGALLCLALSLFMYESGIVMLALWGVYLFTNRSKIQSWVPLTVGLSLILGLFFISRALVLDHKPELASIGDLAKGMAFSLGALLATPADSILMQDLYGAPLPSEFHLDQPDTMALPLLAGLAMLAGIAALSFWRALTRKPEDPDLPWQKLLLIGCTCPLWLAPFAFFNPHPSETYLLLPAASSCLLLAAFLYYSLKPAAYVTVLSLLGLLFFVATYHRNQRVIQGSSIAHRILTELPVMDWRQGSWNIYLAESDVPLPRYGLYSYHGLATIDVGDPSLASAQAALQLVTANSHVVAKVLTAQQMTIFPCPQPHTCFWVSASGMVQEKL